MTTAFYQVVLTGKLQANISVEQAIATFSRLLKVTPETASRVFDQAPIAIKKNIDQAVAERIHRALVSVGIETRVEGMHDSDSGSETEKKAADDSKQLNVSAPSNTYGDSPGFQFNIEGQPDYAFLTVQIPQGDTIKVEASAMAAMDSHLVMKTKAKGGLGRLLTSESIFINEFTAENGPGEIGIAPGSPGDLAHVYLQNETIFLQNSAFVASSVGVETETKWQGFTKGFFSGGSLFLIRCSGQGDVWFNTYGGMIMLDVDGDYVVDTGNIVAFTESLDYQITKVGGYKSLFFSGEGFVCRFSGKGKVWIQTRSVQAFTHWVEPFRPVESGSSSSD